MKKESKMALSFKFSVKKSELKNKVQELIFKNCENPLKAKRLFTCLQSLICSVENNG